MGKANQTSMLVAEEAKARIAEAMKRNRRYQHFSRRHDELKRQYKYNDSLFRQEKYQVERFVNHVSKLKKKVREAETKLKKHRKERDKYKRLASDFKKRITENERSLKSERYKIIQQEKRYLLRGVYDEVGIPLPKAVAEARSTIKEVTEDEMENSNTDRGVHNG